MFLGYDLRIIHNAISTKTFKNEEERQTIVKYCLGSTSQAYNLLNSDFPITNIERLQLKWKALRNPTICATMIINKCQHLNVDELNLAWEVALEYHDSCYKLLTHYPMHVLDENRYQQLVNTAILSYYNIPNVLGLVNEDYQIRILSSIKQLVDDDFEKNVHLVEEVRKFLKNHGGLMGKSTKISESVRHLSFNIVLKHAYSCKYLALDSRFKLDELQIVYNLYSQEFLDHAKNEYKYKHDLDSILQYFRLFKWKVSLEDENFLIKKLKTKRHFEEIDDIIDHNKLSQESIDKLHSILLAKKILEYT